MLTRGRLLFASFLLLCVLARALEKPDAGPILVSGESATVTVRWLVQDGYYIDTQPPGTITFSAPKGVQVSPVRLETTEKITAVLEQMVKLTAARELKPGNYEIKAVAEYQFCSLLEGQCQQETQTLKLAVTVVSTAKPATRENVLLVQVPSADQI